MKNFKTSLLIALLILSAVSLVFAGGGGDSGKTVLNIMGYGDNAGAEGQSFVRIVEAFEAENPDIDVQYELLFDDAYHQKVVARLASGDVPDVAYMGSDARWGAPWQEAGQQVDITHLLDTNKYDLAKFGAADNADGDYYYVPLGIANITTVVFANVALLDELGLDLPETYADMKAMVSVANRNGIEVLGTHGAGSWVWGSCVYSTIVAQSTGMADFPQKAVAGDAMFTDAGFVDGLEFLEMMVDDGVLSPESVLTDTGTGISNFNNGQYLFFMSGQWDAGNISPELQETMDMIAFPEIPGSRGQVGTVAAAKSVGYGITKAAMDKGVEKAAMMWIDFFNSEAETEQRLRDGSISGAHLKGYTPPSDMPRIVALKAELAGSAPITQVIDAFLTGAPNDALNTGMQQIVSGSKSPQQVANEVEALAR